MSLFEFPWLMKLIHLLSKASGFIFISIDFSSWDELVMTRHSWNYIFSVISLGFSLYSNTFDAYFPVEQVTHSKIMEIGVNLVVRVILGIGCILKASNILYKRRFFSIISKLHWFNVKVADRKGFKLFQLDKFLYFTARTIWNHVHVETSNCINIFCCYILQYFLPGFRCSDKENFWSSAFQRCLKHERQNYIFWNSFSLFKLLRGHDDGFVLRIFSALFF